MPFMTLIYRAIKRRRSRGRHDPAPTEAAAAQSTQRVGTAADVIGERPDTSADNVADPLTHRLQKSAWNHFISDGELRQGYLARRAAAVAVRTASAVRHGDLTEQLAALEAELKALVHQSPEPATPPPTPKVLRPVSQIIPFTKGEKRHG